MRKIIVLSFLLASLTVASPLSAQGLEKFLPSQWHEDDVKIPYPFDGSSSDEIIFAAREAESSTSQGGELVLFPVTADGNLSSEKLVEELSMSIKDAYRKRAPIDKPGPGTEDLSLREETLGSKAHFIEFFQLHNGTELFCQVLVRKVSDKTAHVLFVTYHPSNGAPLSRGTLSKCLESLFHEFVEGSVRSKPEGVRFSKQLDKHIISLSLESDWTPMTANDTVGAWRNERLGCEIRLRMHGSTDFNAFLDSQRKSLGSVRSDLELGTSDAERLHLLESASNDSRFTRLLCIQGKPVGRFFASAPIVELQFSGPMDGKSPEELQRIANRVGQQLKLRRL